MEFLTENLTNNFSKDIQKSKDIYGPIIELLKQKQIPETYPEPELRDTLTFFPGISSLYARDKIIQNSCFCLLAKDWIEPLADWIGKRKCLEIMCGSGALSKSLQDCSIDIHATDNFSWKYSNNQLWTIIENLDAVTAIEQYGKEVDIIICSWPPYQEPAAYNALLKMREINPNAVMIYIGEPPGGCTADDNFFEIAQYVQDESFDTAIRNFKSIWGIHDHPYLIK